MDIHKIFEDAMVAAGAAGGDVVAPSAGIGANDVLGHCDHKADGYLGSGDPAGCFHIPGKCKVPFRRHEICNGGGKKKKKTFYDKGMTIVTDAELDRPTLKALHELSEEEIEDFVRQNFGFADDNEIFVEAIFYYPVTKTMFLRFTFDGKVRSFFIHIDFDARTKQLIVVDKKIYSAAEVKAEFKKILGMKGNSPKNVGSDDLKLWVIWGDVRHG